MNGKSTCQERKKVSSCDKRHCAHKDIRLNAASSQLACSEWSPVPKGDGGREAKYMEESHPKSGKGSTRLPSEVCDRGVMTLLERAGKRQETVPGSKTNDARQADDETENKRGWVENDLL